LADSQNGLDTGLNIDAHFATNPADSPLENPLLMELENPLWQYACQVYSQAGMEVALLALQDDHGADINLILQALWLASEGQEWTKACIPTDYAKWMEEQVLPLRQMRRSMKAEWVEKRGPQYDGFRQQVKKLELKAEQYALGMLCACSKNIVCENIDGSGKAALENNLTLLNQFLSLKEYLLIQTLEGLF
jgi:uncharacterized protein (TIGR02444 family)